MAGVILHADRYGSGRDNPLLRDLGFGPTPELVASLLAEDLYVAVATFDCDRGKAVALTQNVDDSWSRMPADGIHPLGPGTLLAGGREFGYASTSTGDLLLIDGEVLALGRSGFETMDGLEIDADRLRVIGGGTLSEFSPGAVSRKS